MKKRQYIRAIRRNITHIILCSTNTGPEVFTLQEVNDDKRKHGFKDCGHHLLVRKDGTVEVNRLVSDPARCSRNHNPGAVSIAYIGGNSDGEQANTATLDQLKVVEALAVAMAHVFPMATVVARNECTGTDFGSTCLRDMAHRANQRGGEEGGEE